MHILYTPRFQNAYKKLPIAIKNKAEKAETLFRRDTFDSRLKTHKLHGKLKNQWSFSVDRRIRILFEFINKSIVIFLDIGDHDIYQ